MLSYIAFWRYALAMPEPFPLIANIAYQYPTPNIGNGGKQMFLGGNLVNFGNSHD